MAHLYRVLALLLLGSVPAFSQYMNLGAPGLKVGVGFAPGQVPRFPLSFPNILGDKISFWNTEPTSSTAVHYGIGIQGARFQLFAPTINDDIVFGIGSSANFTENVRITGDGKVGIGTTNPSSRLTVQSAQGSAIGLDHVSADGIVRVGTFATSVSGGFIQTHSNHPLHLSSNNDIARLTVATNGNIGIGTTIPQARLHVSGSLRLATGNQGEGRVLTSDADGDATWQKSGYGAVQIVIGTATTYNLSSNATPTLIGNELLDEDGRYTNSVYTVGQAGLYAIHGALSGFPTPINQAFIANGITYTVQVYVNGTLVRESVKGDIVYYNDPNSVGKFHYEYPAILNAIIRCNVNDTIVLKLKGGLIGGSTTLELSDLAYFTIAKL